MAESDSSKNVKRDISSNYDITKPSGSTRAAVIQIAVSLSLSLGVISSGMGMGFPSITSNLLLNDTSGVALTASQVSWFASITAIACPFGGSLSGFLTDKIGRRSTLMAINILATISWIIIGFSSRSSRDTLFTQLMIARVLIGLVVGMSTTPAVMYVSEVCDPKFRGRLTLMSSPFFTAFGLLLVYFLGFLFPTDYRVISLISAGVSLSTVIIASFLPESPVYLVMHSRYEQGRMALSLLKNLENADPKIEIEIQNIILNKSSPNFVQSSSTILDIFKSPEFYKPYSIMAFFFTIQQLSGIFVVFIYASQFSIEAGVFIDEFFSAVIIGVIRCCTTILIAFASDKFGRKPLAVSSGVGMFFCMLGLAICMRFPLHDTIFNWLPALLLYLFVFSGSLGILTLPFAMVGELYPQKIRGFAVGLTLSTGFVISFFVIKTFSSVFEIFGSFYIFSFYAAVALVGIAFGLFVLPETKGKSLQETENLFSKR